MKLSIISNVILNLVGQKLQKKKNYEISNYYGDIVAILNTLNENSEDEIIFIHLDSIFQKFDDATLTFTISSIKSFALKSKSQIIVSTIFDNNISRQLKNAGSQFEINKLFSELKKEINIFEFDFLKLLLLVGLKETYNYSSGFLFQMPYKKPMIELISESLDNYITFLTTAEKKLIITDADNTLWGGILGEDGVENLKVNNNADGIVFQQYQQFLKQKLDDGFLLGICSKNNFNDVKTAFEQMQMPLKWDDFIVKEINWEPKYHNVNKIAESLNLGISSFIFIDDNDFEIESVRNLSNNQITCYKFENNYDSLLTLMDKFEFKRKQILDEDRSKHLQYQNNQQRSELLASTDDFENYLTALDIKNSLQVNDIKNLDRICQMTEKTNQFNFNKKIYNQSQLLEFINNNGKVLSFSSSDKFGDYGIIGLAFLEIDGYCVKVINILMSCRALGKGIETSFYNNIINFADEISDGITSIEFKPSDRNQLAEKFFIEIKSKYFDGKKFRKVTGRI